MSTDKIEIMTDNVQYYKKPKEYVKIIAVNMKRISCSIEVLAQKVANGYNFRPAILEGGNSDKNWNRQQLFAIDFDHNLTFEDAIARCISTGVLPVFAYKSFNYKVEDERFRVVFCIDRIIYDPDIRDQVMDILFEIFKSPLPPPPPQIV